jgi:phosphoribosyl 1,2-cyclic phosphate phosphodiesterase
VIEAGEVRLLIDAGVMNIADRFSPSELSAILITHFHPDHVQGLFHMRWGVGELDVFAPHDTEGCADLYKYPGPLRFKHLHKFATFKVGDCHITPVPLVHSKPTLGYCIEHNEMRIAFLSDSREFPDSTTTFLKTWQPHTIFLDCTHPPGIEGKRNHFDLPEAIAISKDYPDSNIVLMHISHQLDAWLMLHPEALPERVLLARDSDVFEF